MIIAVLGTGTGVGKTHLAAALLYHLRARGDRAAGWKPLESGVVGAIGADEEALAQAAPAAAPTWRARAALAPSLAARLEGRAMPTSEQLSEMLARAASAWPTLVLELAGGACSPFDDERDNLDWLVGWPPALRARLRLALVAPDRLGVLHDVSAVVRAASLAGLGFGAVALCPSQAAPSDESTGRNLAELSRRKLTAALPAVAFPHGSSETLARGAAMQRFAGALCAA